LNSRSNPPVALPQLQLPAKSSSLLKLLLVGHAWGSPLGSRTVLANGISIGCFHFAGKRLPH
jgi:hypothetical protein